MKKNAKKREVSHSGFLELSSATTLHSFEKKILKEVVKIAKLLILPDDDEVVIHYTVPRYVLNAIELVDEKQYKHMMKHALKAGDPVVNLTIELKVSFSVAACFVFGFLTSFCRP